MNNKRPSYTPTAAEIARMKEAIFRENLANGVVRLEPEARGRFRGAGIHKRVHRANGVRRRGRSGK